MSPDTGFVVVKLALTIPGAFVMACQQMGGVSVLVNSTWQAGAFVG